MKGLTLHLIKKHFITPKQYQELFPGTKMFSPETLASETFGGKHLRGKVIGPFTDEHRKKLSEARSKFVGWSHSPETIAKMKSTWNENKEERIKTIKVVNDRPEVKERKSKAMKLRIERDGFHLKRGTITKLERTIQRVLDTANIQYQREVRSKNRILGVYRYFDFFVPSLNLIIEVDGEFWHQQPSRLEIDELKQKEARETHTFVRLSDVFSKELLADDSKLLEFLISTEQHYSYSDEIISQRRSCLALKAVNH